MKKCPKCYRDYDDSWKICLHCDIALNTILVREDDDLALANINKKYEREFTSLFYPSDEFYGNWDCAAERLNVMMREILKWLKIDNSKIIAKYVEGIKIPGYYSVQEETFIIAINYEHRFDPFEVAAILAHECMHHYARLHKLGHPDTKKNELITDLSTICAGLGILVINGMSYDNNWYLIPFTISLGFVYAQEELRSFGYFKASEYCNLFGTYLRMKALNGRDVIGFITPSSRHFLPVDISPSKAKNKLKIIAELERNAVIALIFKIILAIAGLAVACVMIIYYVSPK